MDGLDDLVLMVSSLVPENSLETIKEIGDVSSQIFHKLLGFSVVVFFSSELTDVYFSRLGEVYCMVTREFVESHVVYKEVYQISQQYPRGRITILET